jgi:hypothetical protein
MTLEQVGFDLRQLVSDVERLFRPKARRRPSNSRWWWPTARPGW